MILDKLPTPAGDEYAPFYAPYIAQVAGKPIGKILTEQLPALRRACEGLSESEADARYAPGKWSVRQMVGHLADAERVFGYRALRISRGDATPLAGFDENSYVEAGGFDRRPLAELLDDFQAARAANLSLLASFPSSAWGNRGIANGREITLGAIVHIIAGHVQHHLSILRDRYGLSVELPDGADAPAP